MPMKMYSQGDHPMAITYLSGKRIQGSSTGTGSFTPSGSFNVRYIVCGGGAGSGTNNGGGGGAGAFITNASYGVIAQTYSIIVGEKSVGQLSSVDVADGGDSTFGDIVAGGGGAGGNQSIDSGNGQDATSGSGGGGTESGDGGSSGSYGYDGGDGGAGSPAHAGGGGGGSSAVGVNSTSSSGGNGGAGTDSDITGSTINYCAGGGGSTQNGSVGQGGNSSAGDGAGTDNGVGGNATTTAVGTSAGNGGGGGRGSTYKGGDGSDGIIILRFVTSGNSYSVVGGEVDIDGSDTVITFTVGNASGIDEKTTVTDVPVGSEFEQTDNYKSYQRASAGEYATTTYTNDDANDGDSNLKIYGTGRLANASRVVENGALDGFTMSQFTVKIQKVGSPASSTIYGRIWNTASESIVIVATSSDTFNTDDISTSAPYTNCTFTFPNTVLLANYKIGIYAEISGGTSSNAIVMRANDTTADNADVVANEYNPTEFWNDDTAKNMWQKFERLESWVERGTAI